MNDSVEKRPEKRSLKGSSFPLFARVTKNGPNEAAVAVASQFSFRTLFFSYADVYHKQSSCNPRQRGPSDKTCFYSPAVVSK